MNPPARFNVLRTEPRRLWPRYLVYNPLFIARTFLQLTGLKKYPLEITEELKH